MKYKLGKETVIITCDPSLSRSKISLKAMIKVLKKEGGGILVEFNRLEEEVRATQEQPLFLRETLMEYKGVFELPSGLPPTRNHEHAIL